MRLRGATMADLSMRILLSCNDAASGAIRQMASNFGPVGTALAAVGGVAIGVGVASVQMAASFQSGITSLSTGAGEAQSNLKMVSQGILQIATDTGTSTQQLISGMYQIESSGIHGADALRVLTVAAQGAKVGSADLGVVTNSLTTILTDYGMSSSQATSAMNGLITTVASGKTH